MREIKFRGKVISTGKWITGCYVVNRGEHFIVPDEFANPFASASDYMVDPNTIGQYTGITDRDEVEIYEGDIIEYRISDAQNWKSVVRWDKDTSSWAENWRSPIYEVADLANFERRAKVLGNYHDNPELIDCDIDLE